MNNPVDTDKISARVGDVTGQVTHKLEDLRDRAAGAVGADGSSMHRELGQLGDRVERVESSLGKRLDALVSELADTRIERVSVERTTSWPRRLFWLVIGAATGMAAAYLADPDRGRARRTQLSDQLSARARDLGDDAAAQAKVAADRARGTVIEATKEVLPEDVPDDPKLLQDRIKSEAFGNRDDVTDVVIRVDAPGQVALKGTVPGPSSERDLLAAVSEVEGVIDVRSELSVRSG